MNLSKVTFSEKMPENLNNKSFVFKDVISSEVENIISNNVLKNELINLANNVFTSNIEKLKIYFDMDSDFLDSKIWNIKTYTNLSFDIDKIKEFFWKRTKEYIESVNNTLDAEEKIIKSDINKCKQFWLNYYEEEDKKAFFESLKKENELNNDELLFSEYSKEIEEDNSEKNLYKIAFINKKFLNTDKLKNINNENFTQSLYHIIDLYKKHIDDFLKYLEWVNQYYFDLNDIELNSLNDLFFYWTKYELDDIYEIYLNKINTKINWILVVMIYFKILESIIEEDSYIENCLTVLLLIENIKINDISFENESIKFHIWKPKMSNNDINTLKKSFIFKNKIINYNENKNKLFSIFLSKKKLFLSEDKIYYKKLFDFIIIQDSEKLCSIEEFLNKYFKKDYTENDLLFIFENNLEDFELIKEQVNIENIWKIIKLYNDKFEIHKIKSVWVEWFNKIYEFYESWDLDISNLDEYLVDFNTFNSFILYKSFIKKKINNLKYFRKNNEEYKREYELSEISFTNFLNLSQKKLNDIDTERLINKLNNILLEENIELYINDYYFLLEKIEKIKSKTKGKKEKKKEKEKKNIFIKNFFQSNSEDEIKLVISILERVDISSSNTFESLEQNINLIIKYKSLAEEKLIDNDYNPKFLKHISEYLNNENQQDFYKSEFKNLWIDDELIDDILRIYNSDNSLKLLLYILEKLKLNDLDDLSLLLSEKLIYFDRLKIITNSLSLIEKYNLDYDAVLEFIEYIIKKEKFNYDIELERNNFLRETLSKYKKWNWNSWIKILIIDFLKDEKSEDDLKNEIEKFEKIEIILNNKFDKSIFEIIKNKNEDKAEMFSSKINQFINNITQDFNSAQSHSQAVDFVKWNWKYTNIIRKKLLQRLKKLNSETYLEHIERIKILNFNTFFMWSENLSWDTENIMKSSADINLPFFESLENFWENTIKNINLKWNNFTRLAEYYNEVFQKHKNLLEK